MENNQDKCNVCSIDKKNCGCGANRYNRFWMRKVILVIIILVGLGILLNSAAKTYGNYSNPRTISINGTGKVATVPDFSKINFTLRSTSVSNDTQSLQDEVATKANSVFAKLKELGIEDKDIQTSSYSVNPRYSYPDGLSTVSGYEASESVIVKVRNTDNVSKVLTILADEKVTEVYGPNFEVDDIEKSKADARDLAIQDAKDKASELSKALGVKIKRIVGYSDDAGNLIPTPMMYSARAEVMNAAGSAKDANIQTGEQEITSNITITFQIQD